MTEEFPDSLEDQTEYSEWISILATNAIESAVGQAADAEYTGDLADTPESRIESEVELEIDDKIDVLASKRTPYDILRLTDKSPSELILKTLTPDKSTRNSAIQLAHDALFQDVLEVVREEIEPA